MEKLTEYLKSNSIYFAYIADGLTDTEISALSSAAYTFRQSIGYY